MNLPRGDRDRPDRSEIVVLRFADRSREPSDADSVTAHDREVTFSLAVEVGHVHGFGIFRPELENIPDLDPAQDRDRMLFTAGADPALGDLREIMELRAGNIAGHVKPRVMIFGLICAAGKIVQIFQRAVEQNAAVLRQPHGSDVAREQTAFLRDHGGVERESEEVAHLRFVYVEIAAQEYHNIRIVLVFLINDRFAALLLRRVEKITNFLDRVNVRRIDLGQRLGLADFLIFNDVFRRFHVGAVAALGADRDTV